MVGFELLPQGDLIGRLHKVDGLASALTLTLMKPEIKLPDIVPGKSLKSVPNEPVCLD